MTVAHLLSKLPREAAQQDRVAWVVWEFLRPLRRRRRLQEGHPSSAHCSREVCRS